MADLTVKTLADFFKREKQGYPPGSSWVCDPIEMPEHLLHIVIDYCQPMLGAEKYFPDLFGKYGATVAGFPESWWQWDFAALQQAPSADLWQMLAIASTYWYLQYQMRYESMKIHFQPAGGEKS